MKRRGLAIIGTMAVSVGVLSASAVAKTGNPTKGEKTDELMEAVPYSGIRSKVTAYFLCLKEVGQYQRFFNGRFKKYLSC